MSHSIRQRDGMLGTIVLVPTQRFHDTVVDDRCNSSPASENKNHSKIVANTMASTTGGEAEALTGTAPTESTVDAVLKKTPSEDAAVRIWELRCKEATAAALEGKHHLGVCSCFSREKIAQSLTCCCVRFQESMKGQKGSSHHTKLTTDGLLNTAQAKRVAAQTNQLKRYFKYMDKQAVVQHNLVDRLLDGIGGAFQFKKMSHFHRENLSSMHIAMHHNAENLDTYNRRQSLVPRLTNYVIHAIRAERDRILKAVKAQIDGIVGKL